MNNDNIFIKQILNMTDDDCDVTDFRVEGHTKYVIPNTLQLKSALPINTALYAEADFIQRVKSHVIQTILFCRMDTNLILLLSEGAGNAPAANAHIHV